jgi:hypothetical protein
MTHPNPDPYPASSQAGLASYHPQRIFDGPMTVIPRHVKNELGFETGDEVRALEMSGVRLILVVTDADRGNAHLGGTAPVEEKLDLLRQVLAGLEALQ